MNKLKIRISELKNRGYKTPQELLLRAKLRLLLLWLDTVDRADLSDTRALVRALLDEKGRFNKSKTLVAEEVWNLFYKEVEKEWGGHG